MPNQPSTQRRPRSKLRGVATSLPIRCIASVVRRARRASRAIFGLNYMPVWLDDITSAIAPLRKLNLLFTLIAIATIPEHFFSLTTPLVNKKRRLYATPAAFFLGVILLTTGLHYGTRNIIPASIDLRYHHLHVPTIGALVVLAVLTPLWIIFVALAGILFFLLAGIGFQTGTVLRLATLRFFDGYTLPLDTEVYKRMSWPRFGWNLLYFSIYAVPALFASVAWLAWALTRIYGWSDNITNYSIPMALVGLLSLRLIVTPYAAVLNNSVVIPTRHMLRRDTSRLIQLTGTSAASLAADESYFHVHLSRLVKEYVHVCRLEARWVRAAEAAGGDYSHILQRDLHTLYKDVPTEHIAWLANWGPGSDDDRRFLGNVLTFILSHSAASHEQGKVPSEIPSGVQAHDRASVLPPTD
jgi:hypothetical protein